MAEWKQIKKEEFYDEFKQKMQVEKNLVLSNNDNEWPDFIAKTWSLSDSNKQHLKQVEQLRFDETEHEEWVFRYYIAEEAEVTEQ